MCLKILSVQMRVRLSVQSLDQVLLTLICNLQIKFKASHLKGTDIMELPK